MMKIKNFGLIDCRKKIKMDTFLREWKCCLRKIIEKSNHRKIKFVIVSTRQKWGGAIVLHVLCKNLDILGYEAKIYYINDGESYGRKTFWIKHIIFKVEDFYKRMTVKILGEDFFKNRKDYAGYIDVAVEGCTEKVIPIVDSNTIVVYPDVVFGNFLHAKNVVRWLLYYNRYGDDAYGKNDMFFAYREIFNDKSKNPQNRILGLSYFNFNLYKQTNFGNRDGCCYIIRKGSDRNDLPLKFDGPIIDTLSEKEKVTLFNKCKYCISYDTQTAYSVLASICGCISIVIPEEGKSWMDYRGSEEERYGVAFGKSDKEIAWAIKTAERAKKRFEESNKKGLHESEKFARDAKLFFRLN